MSEAAPAKPILALTLALAGKRQIEAADLDDMRTALALIFAAVGETLATLGGQAATRPDLSRRFSTEHAPRLTLITGLADGADQISGRLFLSTPAGAGGLERVLGAVLPCGRDDFVMNSPVHDRAAFTAAEAACGFIIELDGVMPPQPALAPRGAPDGGNGAAREARRERASAFAAQSEILLRNADILLAIDDIDDEGRIGGTRQTVGKALDQGLPVVLLRLGEPGLAVLRDRLHLDDPELLTGEAARERLATLVGELIGVESAGAPHLAGEDEDYVRSLIAEVFSPAAPRPGVLNALWSSFEGAFKTRAPSTRDVAPPPYLRFRERASALSAYYAGHYRGSFLLGYGLAVSAVAMAVLSLTILLLAVPDGWPVQAVEGVLLGLGALKFAAVFAIALLGDQAKRRRLAYRAADYRYLSERLRAMIFLPHAGGLRINLDWSPPYATRVNAHGVVDHLFMSITRQASPLEALPGEVRGGVVRPDAGRALEIIRHGWLEGQLRYHQANSRTHQAMKVWLDSLSRRLNAAVVTIVGIDIVLILISFSGVLPEPVETAIRGWAAPVLISIAAILPAAVASLNGIRFQSEVSRLADRSEQMAANLSRLAERSLGLTQKPPRLIDAMRLGDDVARLTIDEVAEWSSIYGKEFVEM